MSASGSSHRATIVDSEYVQIASVFKQKEQANQAIEQVVKATGVRLQQVILIEPEDNEFSRKLKGDHNALGRMVCYSHLILGAAGLAVGLITAYLLVLIGPEFIQRNPLTTYLSMITPGIFIGLWVAGLISLRPERSQIIDLVRKAINSHDYAVVVNLRSEQSIKQVSEVFSRFSSTVVASLP